MATRTAKIAARHQSADAKLRVGRGGSDPWD